VLISWIALVNWFDSELPAGNSVAAKETIEPGVLCQTLRDEKEQLEDEAMAMGRQAYSLQSDMMRMRLQELASSGMVNKKNSEILLEYLSYDVKKLIDEKSEVFGEKFSRHIELRPAVVKIVGKLIEQGHLEPYYFTEVQEISEKLRANFAEARVIMKSNQECFKSSLELEQMIDEATEEINGGQIYNGWTAERTAEELVDSIQ
jgi:hypothetical protein